MLQWYSLFSNREFMELRPQDVIVVLKLLVDDSTRWSYLKLGEELAMSASHVFASVDRARTSRLLDFAAILPRSRHARIARPSRDRLAALPKPNRSNLKEFLIHGVKYVFPVKRGGETRGIPTAEAAPPLKKHFSRDFSQPPVWPYADGSVRGIEFSPLYKNAPQAALRDPKLYELLALVDAIREGRAREREIAIRELTARIDAE
jgi:hypothetical protein